ncbi:MAG: hypothetical protein P4M13_08335 [Alphaproteobacteria bacterium]|nr:hypothetical protein [Alphaproteobacteria bacterium]
MRTRLFVAALASLFVLGFGQSALADGFCDPPNQGVSCLGGKDCRNLGSTMMDGDQKNIIACLGTETGVTCADEHGNPTGQCQWKAMTTTSTENGWVSVPLNDKNYFDITCRYMAQYVDEKVYSTEPDADAYYYPTFVFSKFLGVTNTGNDELTGIPYDNKGYFYYKAAGDKTDGSKAGQGKIWVVAIWKNCNP